MGLKDEIDALDPVALGVGDKVRKELGKEQCKMYRVRPRDNLSSLAVRFYGSAKHLDRIVKANPIIDDPHLIFAGHILRIPKEGLMLNAEEAAGAGKTGS